MAKKNESGKFFADGRAVVLLRSGQVITNAKVMEKSFRIATADLGTLTFKVPQISMIVYKNLPNFPTDWLRTIGGSELNGDVLNDSVHLHAADFGEPLAIAKAKIAHITF